MALPLFRFEPALERPERRLGTDRRRRVVYALIRGSLQPRRRGPRRAREASLAGTDWHDARWLAVALSILLLSLADALLTVRLLAYGALEANPVMAAALDGNSYAFAAAKFGLTAAGVVLLTLLARARAFGRVPVGALLQLILVGYVALLGYEIWMLHHFAAPWPGLVSSLFS